MNMNTDSNYTSLVQKSTQVLRITCSPENLLNKIFSEESVSIHRTPDFSVLHQL